MMSFFRKVKQWGIDKALLTFMILSFSSLVAYDQISNKNITSLSEFMSATFRFVFTLLIIFIFYKFISQMFRKKKKQCPKCNGVNLNYVKPTVWQKAKSAGLAPWGKPSKTLNVCKDCGFSWEDR